jgi:hypothetical protein
MAQSRPFVRALVVGLGAASVACGMLIGLDERPARPIADASSRDVTTVLPGDGGAGADASFCAEAKGALFCDDFDVPGQAPSARWSGVASLSVGSPLLVGEAGVAIVTPERPQSAPNALEATLFDDNYEGLTTAGLLQEFPGDVATAGFVVSFSVQANELEVSDAMSFKDVGPDPTLYNEPGVGVGGFFSFTPDFKRYGVGLGIGESNVIVSEGSEGEVTDNYAKVGRVNVFAFREQGWVRITLLCGPRDRVLAYASTFTAPPTCPAGPLLTIAFTSLTPGESGCLVADPARSPVGTGTNFAVVLGVSASDPTRARFRFDNVRLDPLP